MINFALLAAPVLSLLLNATDPSAQVISHEAAKADHPAAVAKMSNPGWALGTFSSTIKKPNRDSVIVEYRIMRVVEQPEPSGGLSLDTRPVEEVPQNESQIPLTMQVSKELRGKTLLLEVGQAGKEFAVVNSWGIDDAEIQQAGVNEAAGVEDLRALRRQASDADKSLEFVTLTATTKYPSRMLMTEGRRIVHESSSRTTRWQVVQGMATLLAREDAPFYVRRSAYESAVGLEAIEDRPKFAVLFASKLMDVFHVVMRHRAGKAPDAVSPMERLILELLPDLVSDRAHYPELAMPEKQMIIDVRDWKAQELAAPIGKASVEAEKAFLQSSVARLLNLLTPTMGN